MIGRLAGLVVLVAIIAATACSGDTRTAEPTETTSSTTTLPPPSTTVPDYVEAGEWLATDGRHLFRVMEIITEAGTISPDDPTQAQIDQLSVLCYDLASSTEYARAAAPIPIRGADLHWQEALERLTQAGELCIDSLSNSGTSAQLYRSVRMFADGGTALVAAMEALHDGIDQGCADSGIYTTQRERDVCTAINQVSRG